MTPEELETLAEETENALKSIRNELRTVDEQITRLQDDRAELEKQFIFINGRLSLLREMTESELSTEGTDGQP